MKLLPILLIALTLSVARASSPADMPYTHKRATVGEHTLAFVDEGTGNPVVFLHGNPTSSYLWRNILPAVVDSHRVIAPDLLGMGESDKPDIEYNYGVHREHLFALLDQLDLQHVTLVLHDWGSVLGLDWAQQNPTRLKSVVMMEAVLPPVWPVESYEAMGALGPKFNALRTPGVGEALVIENNVFIDQVLGHELVVNPLTDDVLAHYNSHFPDPWMRRVVLAWTRQVPIAGEPADVTATVRRYSDWLQEATVPKLLIHADPGALVPAAAVPWLQNNLPNLTTVGVGPGSHFIQEDNPAAIAAALEVWVALH